MKGGLSFFLSPRDDSKESNVGASGSHTDLMFSRKKISEWNIENVKPDK